MYVLRNLLEAHVLRRVPYYNNMNNVKSSTVTARMMWAWPIFFRFIQ